MLRALILVFWGLLLAACAQTPPLLLPEALGQNVQVNQLVSVPAPQGQRQFNVVWSRESNVFSLAGLSLAGQLLFNISQQDGEIRIRHALPDIPANQLHQLIRQIQWAYWPLADINAAMPAGWSLTEDKDRALRQVYRNGTPYMVFQFDSLAPFSSVKITQAQGPELQVTTISVQALDVQAPGRNLP
ncbi:DUF3261 domain-containing protein [Simiduia agarivorans]|nr:DUF3261 domain-containing protein [Simiduia agarivorans]